MSAKKIVLTLISLAMLAAIPTASATAETVVEFRILEVRDDAGGVGEIPDNRCVGVFDAACTYCSYEGGGSGQDWSDCDNDEDGYYWTGCGVWVNGYCETGLGGPANTVGEILKTT